MNRDRLEGQWRELKGKVRERWGKLTNDDVDQIAGKRDQLVGKIQERYGWARDQVEREVKEFENGLGDLAETAGRQSDGDPREIERGSPARAPQPSDSRERSREERPRRQA